MSQNVHFLINNLSLNLTIIWFYNRVTVFIENTRSQMNFKIFILITVFEITGL